MRFPGRIPVGVTTDMLFNSVNMTPTMLSLVGVTPPALDGLDLSAQVTGAPNVVPDYTVMVNVPYIHKSTNPDTPDVAKGKERAIVHDLYKLNLSTVRTPELYDLTADPGEVNNLWATQQNTARVTQMKIYFQEWITRTGDTLAPTQILQMP